MGSMGEVSSGSSLLGSCLSTRQPVGFYIDHLYVIEYKQRVDGSWVRESNMRFCPSNLPTLDTFLQAGEVTMDLYIISSGRLDAVMTEEEGKDENNSWDETVLYHMDPVLFKEKHALVSSSSSSSCVVVVVVVGRGSFMILGSFQVFQVSNIGKCPLPGPPPSRQDRNDEQLQVGRVFIMGERLRSNGECEPM